MTSRHRLASALDRVFPHLLILLYSLGAALIYYHHWPFPSPATTPFSTWTPFITPAFTQPSPFGITWLPGSPCYSQECFSFPSTEYGSPQTAHRPKEALYPPGRCPPTTTHLAL